MKIVMNRPKNKTKEKQYIAEERSTERKCSD